MGQSTDGQICFGILLEEDQRYPWNEHEDRDLESWWRETVSGFDDSKFDFLYTADGHQSAQWSKESASERWKFKRAFDEAHPCPVCLFNAQHSDYPLYILAWNDGAPALIANRGGPEVFDPASLVVKDGTAQALLDFCTTYGIQVVRQPQWYLSSYWG